MGLKEEFGKKERMIQNLSEEKMDWEKKARAETKKREKARERWMQTQNLRKQVQKWDFEAGVKVWEIETEVECTGIVLLGCGSA